MSLIPQGASPFPLVTVIMTFLDAERYMVEAIESVIGQSLSNWELILVNDGSQDASVRIAADYAERYPDRIRLLQHTDGANHGIAASRNLGMEAARGAYIAFLDADDVYEQQRLARHVHYLEADSRLGVVLSADLYWYSWNSDEARCAPAGDRVIDPSFVFGRSMDPPAPIVSTLLTAGATMPAACSITFRASAFREIGGAPERFRGHYEDQALICKLLLAYPMLALGEPLARYRQHRESLTQGNAPMERVHGSAAHVGQLQFLDWLLVYIAERGLALPELRAWIDTERQGLIKPATAGARGLSTRVRTQLHHCARHWLPAAWLRRLSDFRHQCHGRRIRRRVMRRVEEFESSQPGKLDRAIRDYWNERIHDTKLSEHPFGSAEFFAALDSYRLQKCDYLTRVIDFDSWAGREVLEVGCGAGLDLVRFARGGAHVTGVDIACSAIALARDNVRTNGQSAALIEADGSSLPFRDATFDLVYCHGVLSFVREPAAVIAEAHRVLKPGGEAILMVYNRRSWMNFLFKVLGSRIEQGHADAPAFRPCSREEFELLVGVFAEKHLLGERLPTVSSRRGGVVGWVFNGGILPALRALPDRWLRPYGWHMLAFCRKGS